MIPEAYAWMRPGALAEYAPSGPRDPWFPCVIASEPWQLSGHTIVVRLEGLPEAYSEYTCRKRSVVPCAACGHVRPREVAP